MNYKTAFFAGIGDNASLGWLGKNIIAAKIITVIGTVGIAIPALPAVSGNFADYILLNPQSSGQEINFSCAAKFYGLSSNSAITLEVHVQDEEIPVIADVNYSAILIKELEFEHAR